MLLSKNDFLLFIGDSVTDANRMRPIGEGELFEALGTGYVRAIDSLTQALTPELNLRVVNTGISGNTVLDLEKRWQTDALDFKPDWLCVLIGINDAYSQFHSQFVPSMQVDLETYTETLDRLIASASKQVKGIVLMTPFLVDPNPLDPARCRIQEYSVEMKKIADKYNTRFIDLQSVVDDYCQYRHSSFLTLDRIHPNAVGCMLIAKAFLKEMGFSMELEY